MLVKHVSWWTLLSARSYEALKEQTYILIWLIAVFFIGVNTWYACTIDIIICTMCEL